MNANAVEVYATNVNPPRLATGTNTIKVEKTPLAAAMSRSGKYLYVVCYDASALDIIDLTTANFSTKSVTLAAKPEQFERNAMKFRPLHDRMVLRRVERLSGAEMAA